MSIDASLPPASVTVRPIVRKTSPVTTHPWFPAIVALWFAALLGLSSLVLAPAMLERIVAASRIDTIVAAAAPPLGQTARLLLALGLAGLGGIFGLVLGRTLAARALRVAPIAATDEAPDQRSGDSGQATPALGLRDRLARLTGQGDGPRDFEDLPKLRARDRHPDAPGRKPLSAEDVIVADVMAADSSDTLEFLPQPVDAVPDESDLQCAEVLSAAQDDEAVVHDEPLELEMVVAKVPASPPGLSALVPAPAPAPTPAAVAAIAGASLDSLGVVQLTERLAISMRERRERDARRTESARANSGQTEEPPVVLPSLVARHPAPPVPQPAPQPATDHSDAAKLGSEALDTGYSSLLGLTRKPVARGPARPALHSAEPQVRPGPFSAPTADAPFAVNEGTYQGTTAPSNVSEASDPAENYRALKAALSSLQQISGTR